jgi:hypothetical protein
MAPRSTSRNAALPNRNRIRMFNEIENVAIGSVLVAACF